MDGERRAEWSARHRDAATLAPPSRFVLDALDCLAALERARPDAEPERRRALDVACGRGRHALVLARRGYAVTAVDYAVPAVTALAATAREAGLAIDCVAADVTAWVWPRAYYDLVVVVDFLERSLFPTLRAAVAAGGCVLVETFLAGQGRLGHPNNPAYLLAAGELAREFARWHILAAHEGEITRAGRPAVVSGILAQRD